MELVPYADEDLWLTEALETDEQVMAELGGAWPRDAIPGIHERRLNSIAAGTWLFTIAPEPDGPPVGMIGIFGSDLDGDPISEATWLILPAHQGRGYASEALRKVLERAQADGRWGPIHAFPGVTNGPSNALCRKFGFALVGERSIDYGGRSLRCNHWVLGAPAARGSQRRRRATNHAGRRVPVPADRRDAGRAAPRSAGGTPVVAPCTLRASVASLR